MQLLLPAQENAFRNLRFQQSWVVETQTSKRDTAQLIVHDGIHTLIDSWVIIQLISLLVMGDFVTADRPYEKHRSKEGS